MTAQMQAISSAPRFSMMSMLWFILPVRRPRTDELRFTPFSSKTMPIFFGVG